MKVLSVTANADHAFGTSAPPGEEDYLVGVTLRYVGAGSDTTESVIINAIGSHDFAYPAQDCDRSDLVEGTSVFSDQSATGNICFVIAANDAGTLLLFVKLNPDPSQRSASLLNPNIGKPVWFAVRPS
jgi:hypothetical protein